MLQLSDVLHLDRPLIGIDTETTGTNPATSRIVELALEIHTPVKPAHPAEWGSTSVREFRTLVNPGIPIPPGATAVHGITDAQVQGCRVCGMSKDNEQHLAACPDDCGAHDFRPWPMFADLADSLLKGFAGADFCGYNVRFDLRQLSAEFTRAKQVWDYEDARVIDAFRLWQIAEARSLIDAANRFLTPEDKESLNAQAHNALGDVRWSTRVLASQLKTFAKLPRDLQMLHDLCSPGWYDAEGKLQWKEGELCVSFGQHRDTPLRRVPRSYLDWMTKGNFSMKVKDTCRDALRGVFPPAPSRGPMEDA